MWANRETAMLLAMPDSLRAEHEELRADLEHAIRIGGRIGEAARALESLLRPHFRKEDANVLLALGLLQSVAQGKIAPAMGEVVVMAERLKMELPEMLAEHDEIRKALERLGQEAIKAGRPHAAHFAAKLLHHARLEEDILYPAAIVLGEYLKFRLSPDGTPAPRDEP
jgi:hemerythrin HHE cation binding domain-containing protein